MECRWLPNKYKIKIIGYMYSRQSEVAVELKIFVNKIKTARTVRVPSGLSKY